MRYRFLLLLALLPWLITPAQAGIIFGRKKEKIDPKSRVPQLIVILKADGDADKRGQAAEELRTYDASAYPEIIPALVNALLNDPKPAVRLEAVQSLGKVRPVTQEAGDALEQALANDASMRVRLQARSTLLQYHWAGYRSGKKPDAPPLTPNREPPLAGPDGRPIASTPVPVAPLPPAIQTTPPSKLPTVVPTSPTTPEQPGGIRGFFSGFRSSTPAATPATSPLPRSATNEPPLAAPTAPPPLAPVPVPATPAPAIPTESGPVLD
ncbi:MAG: HEAT repeat domain-containing protein [Gemmataceae bacterium]